MNIKLKKITALFVITIFLILALSPSINCVKVNNFEKSQIVDLEEVELDLLRGEYYLYIDASENVSSSNIRYSFPPEYGYQIPIIMEIFLS